MNKTTMTQVGIEMFDTDRSGRLIRAYQIETPQFDNPDPAKGKRLPIFVSSQDGWAETLASILEEREKYRQESISYRNKFENERKDYLEMRDKYYQLSKKKWYQFWINH